MMGSVLTSPTSLILKFLSLDEDEPVTVKKIFIIILLKLWHFVFKPRFHFHDYDNDKDFVKSGVFPSKLEWKFECPQESSYLEKGDDEVIIYGVNSKKECLMVRIARNNDNTAEAWLYLRLSNGQLYVLQESSKITDNNCFNAAGLRLQCLSPLRIWRIFYNGLIRGSDGNAIHIKFSFIWSALSDVYDFTSDINLSATTNALIHNPLHSTFSNIQRIQKLLNIYVQHGQIRGTIQFENADEETEMYLWGTRMRNLRNVSLEQDFCHIFAYLKDGKLLHIGIESIDNILKRLHHGQLMNSNGYLYPIKCKVFSDGENINDIENKVLEFSFESEKYKLKFISEIYSTYFMRSKWPNGIELKHITLSQSGNKGHGIILKGKIMKNKHKSYSIEKRISNLENLLVVPLSSSQCQVEELTGGKGASLGILAEIATDKKNFTVPKGIVVTTKAYKLFQDTKIIRDLVSSLEKITWKIRNGVQDECQRVVKEIIMMPIPNIICDEIEKNLKMFYSNDLNKIKFSVRSSACGEDGEDMSAAGQMETYLGICGLKEILTAVKKCWASQFSYVAIEYKRQNGQALNSPMAVVIQEMVNAETAGVMFTCNPVTSNPKYITITANYGLGESVVAAKAEPDTICLERDIDQKLTLNNIMVGAKNKKIIMTDSGNIIEEDIESIQECCLTNEQALYLGTIGIMLEKEFGSCRDIEWCYANNELFLLQSRPITSITTESDFEISHEFDSMFRVEDEYLSTGNIGEVFPGAISPLCLSLITKTFGFTFTSSKWRYIMGMKAPSCPYFAKILHYFNNHALFNVIDGWLTNSSDKNSISHKVMMIASIGRILHDDELFERARERYSLFKTTLSSKIYITLHLIKNILLFGYNLEENRRKYFNYKIKDLEHYKTSLDLYQDIPRHWKYLFMGIDNNTNVLFSSAMYNSILMSILVKEHEGWNNEVYLDFANLLSNCSDVESADVPQSLEALAHVISKDIQPLAFKSMKTEDALNWLQTSSLKSAEEFKIFLDRHGHRCIKEFDPYSSPWRKNQYDLVQTLQDIVLNIQKNKSTDNNNTDIFKKLSKYPNWKSRLMLKFILPQCQKTVRNREKAKSLMIKMFDMIREAYWHLADLMVLEGRLPDKELLFFLSHDEIGELLKTRSARLIAKAIRRKKIHPELDRIIYPEVSQGIPKPINFNISKNAGNPQTLMKGTPVSSGIAKGTARVILDVKEAVSIQQGDILITYSTDIGWSPYFPLLGGVVTEIGGLISHGAVIAREYGLPCVVAIHGAINNIKTGDIVILNGNKGTLQKIEANGINGDK